MAIFGKRKAVEPNEASTQPPTTSTTVDVEQEELATEKQAKKYKHTYALPKTRLILRVIATLLTFIAFFIQVGITAKCRNRYYSEISPYYTSCGGSLELPLVNFHAG